MVVALAALLGAPALRASSQGPLPAFTMLAPDGTAVVSTQIKVPDQWLMIYVSPSCRSCDMLLAALKGWQSPQLDEHTVLVVGGTLTQAESYLQQKLPSEAAAIPWYDDSQGQAWKALRLTGTPVLIGIRKGQIEWMISGVLNDPASLKSVVTTWVGQ
jgi:hypothetical protein